MGSIEVLASVQARESTVAIFGHVHGKGRGQLWLKPARGVFESNQAVQLGRLLLVGDETRRDAAAVMRPSM